MFDFKACQVYIAQVPHDDAFKTMDDEVLKQYLFDAYEAIKTLYPQVDVTTRMIVKQMFYQFEGEKQGYALLKRQGIKSQKINDASITFNDQVLDPYVVLLIQNSLDSKKSKGHIGRLI